MQLEEVYRAQVFRVVCVYVGYPGLHHDCEVHAVVEVCTVFYGVLGSDQEVVLVESDRLQGFIGEYLFEGGFDVGLTRLWV